jgi:hypothetical protein
MRIRQFGRVTAPAGQAYEGPRSVAQYVPRFQSTNDEEAV